MTDLPSDAGDQGNPYYSPAPAAGLPSGQPPSKSLAMASMITGIVGAVAMILGCCCGPFYIISVLCAIVAVVTGVIAKSQIRAGTATGDGMALAGLICGGITLGLSLIGIVLMFLGMGAQMMQGIVKW